MKLPRAPLVTRVLGVVAAGLFLVVNLLNTWRKGGDVDAYLDAGRRLIEGTPLYAGSTIAFGFVGPPAQALLFAPFALFDPQIAKLLWFVLNVALLWWALTTWLDIFAPRLGLGTGAGADRVRARWGILSLLAIAAPLQSQFEHQNLNVVLLALAAWGARALSQRRADEAGVAFGLAAAIKIYPGLVLVWLALRRQWRAFGVGVLTVVAIGVAPALFRGVDGFVSDARDWQTLSASGWPTRRANQSIAAMWGRYLLGEGPEGYPNLTWDHPIVLWLTLATALLLITPLIVSLCRTPTFGHGVVEEIVGVNAIAILLSPIAWEHYFVGFFPLFLWLGLLSRPPQGAEGAAASAQVAASQAGSLEAPLVGPRPMSTRQRWAVAAFWVGFAALTLLSRPVVGAEGARLLRGWSVQTWAGVLMCLTLATLLASRRWTARLELRVADRTLPKSS